MSYDLINDFGYSLQEWSNLSESEQKKAAQKTFSEMGAEKAAGKLEEIKEYFSDNMDELKSQLRDLKKLARGKNATVEDRKEAEDLVKMIEELKEIPQEFESILKKGLKDYSDGKEVRISFNEDLDGGKIVYKLRSSEKNYLETQGSNPLKGITDDGTLTGKVIKDADGIDGLDYGDIQEALRKYQDGMTSRQPIFFDAAPGAAIGLSGRSPATFRIEKDGVINFVELTNYGNQPVFFESGSIDMDSLDSWPPEILKNCFFKDENPPRSFQDYVHPVKEPQGIERALVNPDFSAYRNSLADFNGYLEPLGDLEPQLEEALATLLNNKDPEKIQGTWSDILRKLTPLGVDKKSVIVQHMILAVMAGTPDKAPLLLKPLSKKLDALFGNPPTSYEIASAGVLRTLMNAEASPFEKQAYTDYWKQFASLDAKGVLKDGSLTNHQANIDGLKLYEKLMTGLEISSPSEATKALACESQRLNPGSTDDKKDDPQARAAYLAERKKTFQDSKSLLYAYQKDHYPENIGPEWNVFMNKIFDKILTADGEIAPNICDLIFECAQPDGVIDGCNTDELIACFICMLGGQDMFDNPFLREIGDEILDKLAYYSRDGEDVINWLCGGDNPYRIEQASKLLHDRNPSIELATD